MSISRGVFALLSYGIRSAWYGPYLFERVVVGGGGGGGGALVCDQSLATCTVAMLSLGSMKSSLVII